MTFRTSQAGKAKIPNPAESAAL